jgi:hypothetical protein
MFNPTTGFELMIIVTEGLLDLIGLLESLHPVFA